MTEDSLRGTQHSFYFAARVEHCQVIVATLATVTKAIKTAIKTLGTINSAIILSAYVRCHAHTNTHTHTEKERLTHAAN